MSFAEELTILFAGHGIRVVRRGDWLVPDGSSGPYLRTVLTPFDSGPNGATVRLDVEIAVLEKYNIVESFAGLGTTEGEAASNALDNFCQSSFHVMLAAFYGYSDPD